jgi:hypothetical protein
VFGHEQKKKKSRSVSEVTHEFAPRHNTSTPIRHVQTNAKYNAYFGGETYPKVSQVITSFSGTGTKNR